MDKLITPSSKYINRVEKSAHYLNCPKHMLNHDLDCLYRQATSTNLAIQYVYDFLKSYSIECPITNAKEFVKWRSSISMAEFSNINKNPYVKELPLHIQKKHEHICAWIEANTEYYPAVYGGGVKSVPSYPFGR